jgi:hypothetical protein
MLRLLACAGLVSVVETGTIPALFQVRGVHMRASTQYCSTSSCPHPGDVGTPKTYGKYHSVGAPLVSLINMPW